MDELGSLSALIGAIYDTTLDRSLWPSVLKQITRFIGGWGTALDYQDAVTKTVNVFYQDGGIAPRFIQLYNDKYRTLDPCAIGFFFAKVGEPIATADILPYEELLESRAYNELVKPFGLVDCLKTVLDKSATAFASVSVFRHRRDGIVDEASRRRMRLIVPHLRRAVLIGKALEFKAAEAATFADTIDELIAATLLVNGPHRSRQSTCPPTTCGRGSGFGARRQADRARVRRQQQSARHFRVRQ